MVRHHLTVAGAAVTCAALLLACSDASPGGTGAGLPDGVSFPDGTTSDLGPPGDADAEQDAPAPDANPDATPDVPSDPGDDTVEECPGCTAPALCIDGECVAPADCTPGDTSSCFAESEILTCKEGEGGATAWVPTACPPGNKCIGDQCLPSICEPDKSYCEGLGAKKVCNADGTGFLAVESCPNGQYCSSGLCGSSCLVDPKFGAHVGCAFWTVDLPNYPDPSAAIPGFEDPEQTPHSVVVSNPGELEAEVTFVVPPGYSLSVADNTIPGKSSKVFEMPVMNVQKSGISSKAIRIDSTRPVLVHQFNPFNNANVFSNDASLLLPVTALGSDYVVMAWQSGLDILFEAQNGYFTVLAVSDDTEVTVKVSAKVNASGAVPAMAKGDTQVFTLQAGEVLNIESNPTLADAFAGNTDLTGSLVSSNKPVAVFGGHEEAVIGEEEPGAGTDPGEEGSGNCCAEHLEEQLLPVSTLGTDYLAVKSPERGSEPDYWRVQAAEDGVTVTTNPAISGLNGVTLAKKGDWVEVQTEKSFEVSGTGKLQIGQYLVGREVTDDFTGDPAFVLGVPVQRFRDSYTVTVPTGYSKDYVVITKPAGTAVGYGPGTIPQADFTAFGSGAWERAVVALDPGIYVFQGDEPFLLTAFGYSDAVSYGYPGGMDISGAE